MANIQNIPFIRDRFTWLAYFMLAYFAYMQSALGPLMPFLRADLNLSYTVAGLHLSAFAVGMVLAGLTADRVAYYFGRYTVFWAGGIGMAAGAILFIASGRVGLTISSIFLMGWLGTFLLVMVQATLSDYHGEWRTIPLTESNVGASLSAAMAPLSVGFFQRIGIGWQGALVLGTLVILLLYLKIPASSCSRATATDRCRKNKPCLAQNILGLLAGGSFRCIGRMVHDILGCRLFNKPGGV